jgi:hypothetical protein
MIYKTLYRKLQIEQHELHLSILYFSALKWDGLLVDLLCICNMCTPQRPNLKCSDSSTVYWNIFVFFLSRGMSLILVCVILTLFQIDMLDLGILRNRWCSHFVDNPFIEETNSDFCCTTKTSIKKEFTFTYVYGMKHKMWKLLKNNAF